MANKQECTTYTVDEENDGMSSACHLHVILVAPGEDVRFERTSNGLRTDFERLRSTRIPRTLMESTGAPVASYTNLGAEWQPALPRYFQKDVLMSCCLLSTFKIANVKKQKPSEHKLKEYPIKMFQDVSSSLFARTTSSVVTPQISQQIGKHSHWKDCLYCL